MKKNLIVIALMFLVTPLMSFRDGTAKGVLSYKQMALKKLTGTYIGEFYEGGYTYSVFVNESGGIVSEVFYDEGFGWIPVYSFSNGTWSSSNYYFIHHLIYQRTSSTNGAHFHGYLAI